MLHYVCRVEPNDAPFRKPRSDKPQLLRTACSAVAAKNIHARLKSITLCKHPFGRHWLAESHVPAAQRQLKAASRMDPAKCTTLFLVRHGETDWNVERRLQGHKDPHLNARGVLQAQQLAAALAPLPFDALYSSDLSRALQTAQHIAAARGHNGDFMEVHTSPLLRERHLGVLQGLTLEEAHRQVPEAFAALRSHQEDTRLPGGGESRADLQARVVAELERIAAAHPGQKLLLVLHGGVLNTVYRHVYGRACEVPIGNASLHRVQVQGSSWAVLSWNESHHVAQHGSNQHFGGGAQEG